MKHRYLDTDIDKANMMKSKQPSSLSNTRTGDWAKAQRFKARTRSTKGSSSEGKYKEAAWKKAVGKKMVVIKNSILRQKKQKSIKIAETLISEGSWRRYPLHLDKLTNN